MLVKLLKHDLRATARVYVPVILGFIGMCIINKISFETGINNDFDNNIIQVFAIVFMSFYVLCAIALAFAAQIFIAMDFYKTMTGNQGYLTHTIPVKTSTVINSKLIISIFWQLVTTLLIALSVCLLFVGHFDYYAFHESFSEFKYLMEEYAKMPISLFIFEVIAAFVIGFFYSPLMYYASIAIGHLFQKHRLGASILTYFVIYFVIQTISSVVGGAFGIFMVSGENMENFWISYNKLMIVTLLFSVLTSIAFYIATNYIFKKKLNL